MPFLLHEMHTTRKALTEMGNSNTVFLNVASQQHIHHELPLTAQKSNSFLFNGHDLIGSIQPGHIAISGSIG